MVFHSGASAPGKIIEAVGPFVRAAVLSRYGNADKPSVCPGEKNCDRYKSAKGKGSEKERNACRPCELFPTKTERYKKSREGIEALVEMAQYAKRRKDSGYPMPLTHITNLTLETMLMIDEIEQSKQRAIQMEMRTILMAGFGLKEK